jgi:sortase A
MSATDPEFAPTSVARPEPSKRAVLFAALTATIALGAATVAIVLTGGNGSSTLTTQAEPARTTMPTTLAPASTTTLAPASTTTLAPASTTTMAPASTTTLTPTTTVADILPQRLAAPIAPPPDPRGYEDEIQLGGISIPKIGLEAPLLEGIRLTTLDNGPGHWPGTAMPGENGNVVVAAHRTSHGAAFRNIDQLVAGDLVQFSTAAGIIDYTVTGTQIVTPDAIWIVNPTENATATLFACHPLGSVSHRIVVNLELSQ